MIKPESPYVQGICIKCKSKKQTPGSKCSKTGKRKFRPWCDTCTRKRYNTKLNFSYQLHKKGKCEECGFVPINPCQLDVDHIDGDHNNDNTLNLKTLCANCHRLKTYLNKEGRYSMDARNS